MFADGSEQKADTSTRQENQNETNSTICLLSSLMGVQCGLEEKNKMYFYFYKAHPV